MVWQVDLLSLILCGSASQTVTAQCTGYWSSSKILGFACISSGEHIGSNNLYLNPVGCPAFPFYTAGQSNTYNFSSTVSGFSFQFSAFSSSTSCAKMEVKINGIRSILSAANLSNISCYNFDVVVDSNGYITGVSGNVSDSGTGKIIISGVAANSVTISTNDGKGTVFSDPFDCSIIPPCLAGSAAPILMGN